MNKYNYNMNSSPSPNPSYFRYKTDKRLTPPYLKAYDAYKNNKSFRKSWLNVISDVDTISPSYLKYKKTAPLLNEIKLNRVFNSIKKFNPSSLKSIDVNVLVSFSYDYTIVYKSAPTRPYFNTNKNSFVSTLSSNSTDIQEWKANEEFMMTSQSPIISYVITNIYNITNTKTELSKVNKDDKFDFLDSDDEDLEDILDLDLNGIEGELPQNLYNNDNILDDNTTINHLSFDKNSKLPTTTSWDTKTGRCVYDYLIYYYSGDKSLCNRLTYHKLFKYFNDSDLPNVLHHKIKIWEEKNHKKYNDEIKLYWKDIVRIQEKYKEFSMEMVDKLGKINRNEYNKLFVKVPQMTEDMEAITLPDSYFKKDNECGIVSKKDFITQDHKDYKKYVDYYKDVWSVSIRNIKRFCKDNKIPMYCLSQDDKTIAKHLPKTSSGHKSLAFKVANGHFYGIENDEAIHYLGAINSKKTNLITNNLSKKNEDKQEVEIKIVEVKSDKTNTQYLFDKMKELDTQVLNKNVVMKGNQILSFQLEDKKYIFTKDEDNYGKDLLGDAWKGEHIVQIASKIFDENYPNKDHISSMNNQVLEFLRLDGVKHRTHLGATDNGMVDYLEKIIDDLEKEGNDYLDIVETIHHTYEEPKETINVINEDKSLHKYFNKWKKDKTIKEEITKKEDWSEDKIVGRDVYKCYDINKCYGAILKHPQEKFMVLDFNSQFFVFDKKQHHKIPLGLYFVDTDDFTLFHGSNIYSNSIILKGIKEGIITLDNILYACVANEKKSLPKNYFHDLISKFNEECGGKKNIFKNMVNLMTGILGKTETSRTKLNISSNFMEFVSYISSNKDQNPFCYVEGDGDNKIYMYGVNDNRQLQDNSLPIYLQILDESNIRLYDMIKKSGGDCLYRKTDCALIFNPKNPLLLDDDWGGYSKEKYPKLIHVNKNDERKMKGMEIKKYLDNNIENKWNKLEGDDSSDYEKILNHIEEKGGLMLLGRAGCGKSYVIKNIDKMYKEQGKEVAKIAFTNIASLNIGGTTIHKFLKLNEKGDLLTSRIKKIKETISMIIIDEISMVSSFLWRRLYHLKDMTGIPFLLVGDFRQIPPVEDMVYEDYKNHPTLKSLGSNSYVELEKIHRYDTKLAEYTKDLDGMMNIKKSDFKRKIGVVNICYLNKTRKKINALINNKLRPQENFLISPKEEWKDNKKFSKEQNLKCKKEFDENNQSQDIFIYENMPMIARMNDKEDMCNNEKFIVKSITNETITLSSQRPDEDGEEYEHIIEKELHEIQKYLLCCYCMTTHKSQGITIDGAVSIHDWDLMDKKLRYTAITRVKKFENIFMV